MKALQALMDSLDEVAVGTQWEGRIAELAFRYEDEYAHRYALLRSGEEKMSVLFSERDEVMVVTFVDGKLSYHRDSADEGAVQTLRRSFLAVM